MDARRPSPEAEAEGAATQNVDRGRRCGASLCWPPQASSSSRRVAEPATWCPPRTRSCGSTASTNAFAETMRVGEDPTGIAVGEDGDVWVINQGDSTVNRIDPDTGEVTPAKSTLGIPTGVAAGEGAVWITNGFGGPNGTQVSDGATRPTTGSVEPAFASGNAKAIVVAFDSIWLADADRDLVLRYDPEDLDADPSRDPDGRGHERERCASILAVGTGVAEGHLGRERARRHRPADRSRDKRGRGRPDPGRDAVRGRGRRQRRLGHERDQRPAWNRFDAGPTAERFGPTSQADGVLDGPTAIVIAPSGVWVGSDLESGGRPDSIRRRMTVDRLPIGRHHRGSCGGP